MQEQGKIIGGLDVNSSRMGGSIIIKSARELELMIEAGQVVGLTLRKLAKALAPGMTTMELDSIAEGEIRALGAEPAFKGYRGFPASLCVSINHQIVHGIPDNRTMVSEGDLVSLDLGAIVGGMYGDSAVTLPVGAISQQLQSLLQTGEASLYAGIGQVSDGKRIGDISAAVQEAIESRGSYGIVRGYVGHGIGTALHEDPQVPNFGIAGRGPLQRAGMALAIEPMVNLGTEETVLLDDDWTVVTADGSPSVHFEHTVIVTEGAPIITTKIME
jgi:methionyl aminopeptidase